MTMNELYTIFTAIIIFEIAYCFFLVIKWCYKKFSPKSRKYIEIFSVTSESSLNNFVMQSVSSSIEYGFYVTIYGVTKDGKRKVLATTLMYKSAEIAEKEGAILEKVLRKKYHETTD